MPLLTTRSTAAIGGVILALGVLATCGSSGHGDAAVEPGGVDNAPAQIVQMPEGFRNVARKCDGPNMVYSGSRGQTSDAVASGIRCPGAKATTP